MRYAGIRRKVEGWLVRGKSEAKVCAPYETYCFSQKKHAAAALS